MARHPSHIVAKIAARVPVGQDGVWRVIRELGRGDVGDILGRVAADRRTVTGYLDRLGRGGFIEPVGDGGGWRLVIDQPEAPRLRRDGSPAAETGRGQDHMWRSMKMLSHFDARTLAAAASTEDVAVKENTAVRYLHFLHAAGYLEVVTPAATGGRGRRGRRATYALKPAMNTGPLAPQIQVTDFVFDPNTRTVHETGGEARGESRRADV